MRLEEILMKLSPLLRLKGVAIQGAWAEGGHGRFLLTRKFAGVLEVAEEFGIMTADVGGCIGWMRQRPEHSPVDDSLWLAMGDICDALNEVGFGGAQATGAPDEEDENLPSEVEEKQLP